MERCDDGMGSSSADFAVPPKRDTSRLRAGGPSPQLKFHGTRANLLAPIESRVSFLTPTKAPRPILAVLSGADKCPRSAWYDAGSRVNRPSLETPESISRPDPMRQLGQRGPGVLSSELTNDSEPRPPSIHAPGDWVSTFDANGGAGGHAPCSTGTESERESARWSVEHGQRWRVQEPEPGETVAA